MNPASLSDLIRATAVATYVHHLLTAEGAVVTSISAEANCFSSDAGLVHFHTAEESYAATRLVFKRLKATLGSWYGIDQQRNVVATVDGVAVRWVEARSIFDRQKRAAAHQKRVKKEQAEDDRAIYVARHGLDEETTR